MSIMSNVLHRLKHGRAPVRAPEAATATPPTAHGVTVSNGVTVSPAAAGPPGGDGAPAGWEHGPKQGPSVLEGRYEFHRAFSDLARGKRNWQLAALLALASLGIALVGLVGLALQGKTVPYVVEVDRLGRSAAVVPAEAASVASDRVVAAVLAAFVGGIRTVYADPVAQRDAVVRAYAYVAGDARGYLEDYFSAPANDPRRLAQEGLTRSVEVVSVVPVPAGGAAARPWRVRWNETTRSARGGEAVRAWEGYLSVEVHPPTSTAGIERNPLGTFVTEISWTPLAGQLLDESAAGASAAPDLDGPAAPDSVAP